MNIFDYLAALSVVVVFSLFALACYADWKAERQAERDRQTAIHPTLRNL
jgi:hypothetical protein